MPINALQSVFIQDGHACIFKWLLKISDFFVVQFWTLVILERKAKGETRFAVQV